MLASATALTWPSLILFLESFSARILFQKATLPVFDIAAIFPFTSACIDFSIASLLTFL